MHPSFANYSVAAQKRFIEKMTTSNPAKAIGSEATVSDAQGPKVSSMEATPAVPTMSRSPRPKQTVIKKSCQP